MSVSYNGRQFQRLKVNMCAAYLLYLLETGYNADKRLICFSSKAEHEIRKDRHEKKNSDNIGVIN